jgi:hypothetical protein
MYWLPPSRVKVGKGDDKWGHALFADQPVEPFRQLLAEAEPIRLISAAAGEADKIHKQEQSLSVMPSRDVDIDDARQRITQHIALECLAIAGEAAGGAHRPRRTYACVLPSLSADVIRRHNCRRFIIPSTIGSSPLSR